MWETESPARLATSSNRGTGGGGEGTWATQIADTKITQMRPHILARSVARCGLWSGNQRVKSGSASRCNSQNLDHQGHEVSPRLVSRVYFVNLRALCG
jgi:hypothetical protein